MRIVVERNRCAGMSICESLDPERFVVDADGKVVVQQENLDDEAAIAIARDAVESCPTKALTIID